MKSLNVGAGKVSNALAAQNRVYVMLHRTLIFVGSPWFAMLRYVFAQKPCTQFTNCDGALVTVPLRCRVFSPSLQPKQP